MTIPVTGDVLNLKNTLEPRKKMPDYRELKEVKAKCPGFGVQNAIIGKLHVRNVNIRTKILILFVCLVLYDASTLVGH